jgi:hypothetical protein
MCESGESGMNLEQQVCSLELAKRLKELGVRQKSYFVYAKEVLVPEFRYGGYAETRPDIWKLIEPFIYSAYTVSELGELIKWKLLYIAGIPDEFMVYINDSNDNEADVRAKWLIHLLENSLMELPE